MNFSENKYKRRAVIATFLVHLLAILFFYSFGLTYMDPKIEDGIAIEFGYVEEGMGNELIQSEILQTEELEQIQELVKTAPEDLMEDTDELLTQDIVDAPVISDDKEEEKLKVETTIVEKEKKPQASDELQQALSSLFQNDENIQSGDTENSGAQGEQSGSVQGADDSNGGEGTITDGYELGDRKAITKPKPNYACNETGLVVIRVWVNSEGKTYKAELDLKSTTDTSPCLVREAKAAALKTRWLANEDAEPVQIGSIRYNFRKL